MLVAVEANRIDNYLIRYRRYSSESRFVILRKKKKKEFGDLSSLRYSLMPINTPTANRDFISHTFPGDYRPSADDPVNGTARELKRYSTLTLNSTCYPPLTPLLPPSSQPLN